MVQYTLLYLDKNKVVHNTTFLDMESLKEFKRGINELKNLDMIPVDKNGYVWFLEADEE